MAIVLPLGRSMKVRYLPWVLWVAVAAVVSALAVAQWSESLSISWLWLWWLLGAVAVLLWLKTPYPWFAQMMLGSALGAGLMHQQLHTWQTEQIPEVWQQVPISAKLLIDGIAKQQRQGHWTVVALLEDAPSSSLHHARLLVNLVSEREPVAGEVWSVSLQINPNQGRYNPGGFDYMAWLFTQHIQATASAKPELMHPVDTHWHWQRWRWLMMKKMQSVLPSNQTFAGLSVALVLGEASAVTAEQWQLLRDTGTLHMAVVSGTHITLIAGMAWFLGLWLWQWFPSTRISAPVFASGLALWSAVAFALLAGMAVPVQRALVMFVLAMLSIWLKRSLSPLLTLSWALLLVLVWDVRALLQVGFWLSFIATAILLWLMQFDQGKLPRILLVHVGMSLLLAPFLLWFFHEVPTYSALANLLVSPIIEWLLVPLLLLIALLAWILPGLAAYLALVTDSLWSLAWHILQWIAQLPKAVWVFSLGQTSVPSANTSWLTLLDTGRSDLVLVWQTVQGNWLIGSGQSSTSQNTMTQVIVPSLVAMGITQLSGVLLTNTNEKYNQQALALLRRRVQVDQVWSAEDCRLVPVSAVEEQAMNVEQVPLSGASLYRDSGGYCWLLVQPHQPVSLHVSWQAPNFQTLPRQANIIAPAVHTTNAQDPLVHLWVAPGKAVHSSWAEQRYDTAHWGAMTWQLTPETIRLITAYRLQQRRAYQLISSDR